MLRKQKVLLFIYVVQLIIQSGPLIADQLILYRRFLFYDQHLSWKEHVNMVTNKLSKISRVINRLKYDISKQILINVYRFLFSSHLNCGSLVWGQI